MAIGSVSAIDGPKTPAGLTPAALKEAVELALRRNGVPIVSSCEASSNCGRVTAQIMATCGDAKTLELCSVYVRLAYYEIVTLTRPNASPEAISAELYFDDYVGFASVENLENRLQEALRKQVERLALRYLRSNPVK